LSAALEDGWYLVEQLDAGTFAIGEPRYEQQNWSYLLVGEERSLLFDSGSYCGDITGVVARRARGERTILPSHMHYDHLGNIERFGRAALADLPELRACERDGTVTPTETLFLGARENRTAPVFQVTEWLEPGGWIDLGGRRLQLLHTPGHSPDSVSLWEPARDRLLAADFLYRGPLYAQTPGASLADYLAAAQRLLDIIGPSTAIYGAHADAPTAPRLAHGDLAAVACLLAMVAADPPALEGAETRTYEISPHLQLILGAGALPARAGDRLYDDPALARFYDLDNGWGPDLEFCLGLARDADSVLDLGCGTGLFLSRLGESCTATGVDPAGAMLEIARRRPGGERVTWVQADARGLRLGRRFGLVVLTGHVFQVFLSEADQRAVLETVADHLAPGGRFVFDTRNPGVEEWRGWTPDDRRFLDDPELGRIEAWNDAEENPATGIVTYRTHYRVAASGELRSAASRLRFTPRDRLEALIADAGLAVERWMGGWEGRPCTAEAPEIILVGRAGGRT